MSNLTTNQEPDEIVISRLNGMYVGMLNDSEMAAFNRCCERGTATRNYNHPGGAFLGLAKVHMIPQEIL